jgi:hypothetical protein
MQEFKDKEGGRWVIDLTIGAVMRLKGHGFNLFDPVKDDLAQRLRDDLPTFWELLWLLVEPAATVHDIDAQHFGHLMAADCLLDAQERFFAEWMDFFRRLQRPDLMTVLDKLNKYQAKALELVKAKLPMLNEIDSRVPNRAGPVWRTSKPRFGSNSREDWAATSMKSPRGSPRFKTRPSGRKPQWRRGASRERSCCRWSKACKRSGRKPVNSV